MFRFISRPLNKGFTLIEIMIVIAVIGILAASAFYLGGPYINRSRDAARFTHIQQYGRATDLYYKDHDVIPSNTDPTNVVIQNFCADEVFFHWGNRGTQEDSQFAELAGLMGGLALKDPLPEMLPVGPCTQSGSYLYSSIKIGDRYYSLFGSRMAILANGNYLTGSDISNTGQTSLANLLTMLPTYKGTISDTTQGNSYYFIATQH